MSEKRVYVQGSDSKKERFSILRDVRFEWNIIYSCNFRCPYCFFEGKWDEYGKRNVIINPNEWEKIWRRIYDAYGSASILITGGEPFVYPEFTEIIKRISVYHFPINISSNGSINLNSFVNKVDSEKISVSLSFHPDFNKLPDIIKKQQYLRKEGLNAEYINLCVYPPYIKKLEEYAEAVEKAGEKLKIIPFVGNYKGKDYPERYSPVEKKVLGMDGIWEKNVKKKGKLCAAGVTSALIFPDGKVARCGQIGEDFLIGNIFEEEFELLKKALPCEAEICPCLEAE